MSDDALDRHNNRPTRKWTGEPDMVPQLEWWRDNDPDTGRRVVELMELAIENRRVTIGKPKRVGGLHGVWSMRITSEHRLFYAVGRDCIRFLSCIGHDLSEDLWHELREGR